MGSRPLSAPSPGNAAACEWRQTGGANRSRCLLRCSCERMTNDGRFVHDVRMRGFAHRHTVEAAVAWLDAHARPAGTEVVPLANAANRVLAEAVVSDVDVPGFD